MWSKVDKITEAKMLKTAIEFTGDHASYGKAMNQVIYKWKNTMKNNLTTICFSSGRETNERDGFGLSLLIFPAGTRGF